MVIRGVSAFSVAARFPASALKKSTICGLRPLLSQRRIVPGDKALIDDELRHVLAEQQGTRSPRVSACLQYAVFSGGKRLRPLLGLATARAVAGDAGASLSAVAVVELLHCASLVIDDLPCMDNACVRRSRPLSRKSHHRSARRTRTTGRSWRIVASQDCLCAPRRSMATTDQAVGGTLGIT
jgi:geranylgeranyl pyrophosphate synthase